MSDNLELTAAITTEEPEVAATLDELRFLVFKGKQGDSAYDVAVQLGFEGTEEEWLASLKGDTGANGRDGQDGAPGTPGADGEDGVSPTVQTAAITGGHRVTITDKAHPQGQSFDVMNGANGTAPAYLDRTAGVVRLVKGDAVYTSEMMQSDIDDGVPPLITAYGESGEEFFELDTRLVSASPTVGFRSKDHLLEVDDTGHFTLTDRPQGGGNPNAVLYTAQTLTDAQKEQARENVGAASMSDIPSLAAYRTASAQDAIDAAQNTAIAAKYTKPIGGIPKSDLASGVIPSVPQMATQADMSDWDSGKTVDAATLKTDFLLAVDLIDNLGINKANKSELPDASATAPVMDGTAAVGTSTDYARADHIHPSDTTRLAVNQGAANAGKFMVVGNDGNIAPVTMTAWQGGSY